MCIKNDIRFVMLTALIMAILACAGCKSTSDNVGGRPGSLNGSGASQAPASDATTPAETKTSGSKSEFNGSWWEKSSSDERRGFMAGFTDCFVDDLRNPIRFSQSWATYETRMNDIYNDPSKRTIKVTHILPTFGIHDATVLGNKPHDEFGDEWWRQDTELARMGFVEGYFSCRSEGTNSPKWSKSTQDYVKLLDDAYNADDRKGLDAPEYEGSIASALAKYRDQ